MMRKIYQTSVAIALLAVATGAQAKVAQIISLNGDAVVERAGYKYVAQRGMVLEEGDIVRSMKNGKVQVKFDTCVSNVEAAREITVSKSSPCAPATLAKASDLKALSTKSYKIQRIDPNLAEAQCSACKVKLASASAPLLGSSWLPLAGAAGAAGVVAKSGGGSSASNAAVSP